MVSVFGRIFLFPTTCQHGFLLPFSLHERIVLNLLFSHFLYCINYYDPTSIPRADPGSHVVSAIGLQLLGCWDCRFESS